MWWKVSSFWQIELVLVLAEAMVQGSGESKWCKRQLVRRKVASKVKKEERAGWSERECVC